MFRSRSENLRSIYVLLFLSIAFFFLEHQDAEKYARLFAFDWNAFRHGEVWRIVTYQFTQAGQGWFAFPKPLVLFFSLLLLYLMGASLEEEWGTWHFLMFFTLSTVVSAIAAAFFGIPLLGSYFINFTLLFGYASTFPQQTFFLFGIIPVRVRWLAYLAAIVLLVGVVAGGRSNAAAFAGALAAYIYYLSQRVRIVIIDKNAPADSGEDDELDSNAIRNAARFVAIKRAVAAARLADVDRLIAQCERDTIRGVNICPPADFKPENTDGYCIRCEGFSECAGRFLTMHRPPAPAAQADPAAVPEGT